MKNKKNILNNLLKFYLIPLVIFLIFIFFYLLVQKNITVSYYDEMIWTGRSYFFDFFIRKDFKNNIWKPPESSDQPKLGEYLYGAWLYKDYLIDRINNPELDYSKFLIKNGLYNQNLSETSQFQETDDGTSNYYLQKYGVESLKTINFIYKARKINVFLLAGAVITGYYIFVVLNGNVVPALIFSFMYGLNNLLINTSLKAHSEALFILLFNLSLLNMLLYFIKKNQHKYLSANFNTSLRKNSLTSSQLIFSIISGISNFSASSK